MRCYTTLALFDRHERCTSHPYSIGYFLLSKSAHFPRLLQLRSQDLWINVVQYVFLHISPYIISNELSILFKPRGCELAVFGVQGNRSIPPHIESKDLEPAAGDYGH